MKYLYTVQVFHPSKFIWQTTEVEAVSDRQALKLAGISNPGWLVKRIVSMKVVRE